MATTFEYISLAGLRLAHLRQLSSYVHERDRDGWYYGPKDQFEKRHAELIEWIDAAVRYAESEGVKMPKKRIAGKVCDVCGHVGGDCIDPDFSVCQFCKDNYVSNDNPSVEADGRNCPPAAHFKRYLSGGR